MRKTILSEAQWRLHTMLSASGISAYKMVFGASPVDMFEWGGGGEDLMFAQIPPSWASLFSNGSCV